MSNGADRFVGTTAIREALKGKEAVVLDALNVPWRQGRPHICCPHIDHTDNSPSWRWDGRKRRAFCTCGSYSILDVVMKVEGIDFDAAKLRAAAILNRQDLIRVRTGSKHYQQHDTLSLWIRRSTTGTTNYRLITLVHGSG
jgi:hypothetical protein